MQEQWPDWVLVYGDTNSTPAGALAAAKLGIPIAHVEAGLRSYNRDMPEDINRVLTDHAAYLLLTPTDTSTSNLIKEGVNCEMIRQVGDVMFDAALFYGSKAETYSNILADNGLERGHYVMSTVHRQENTNDPDRLKAIFKAFQTVAKDMPVVVPMHPRTRKRLEAAELLPLIKRLIVLPSIGYLDMVMLELGAAVIATDSGAIQKEAYFHGVPCVTLRHETEWMELLELDWNRLSPPTDDNTICRAKQCEFGSRGKAGFPYGDGNAGHRIVEQLVKRLLA